MFNTIHKMKGNTEEGFTLIELLIVVAIIGILAAIAIPGYIGMQERGRKGAITRTAVSAEPEITAWIISAKKGDTKTEVDTDWNGIIEPGKDDTNADLANAGVAKEFVAARTGAGEKSPWGGTLWTESDKQPGTIYLTQTGTSSNITNVIMSVYDGSGTMIYNKILSAD